MADTPQGPIKARAFGGDRKGPYDSFTAGLKIKRVPAQLQLTGTKGETIGEALETRIVLNDFAPTGVKVFVPKPLGVGQTVTLNLELPTSLTVKGRIRVCQDQLHQLRTFSPHALTHWVWMEFEFSSGAEETILKDYCHQLSAEHLGGFLPGYTPPAPPEVPPKTEGASPAAVDTSMMEAPNITGNKAA